jgi:hypothetical protein
MAQAQAAGRCAFGRSRVTRTGSDASGDAGVSPRSRWCAFLSPEPVSLTQVQFLAKAIQRAAERGERDPIVLELLALLELQIRPR